MQPTQARCTKCDISLEPSPAHPDQGQCPKCGRKFALTSDAAAKPKSDSLTSEDLPIVDLSKQEARCASCGAALPPGSVLCVSCGFDLRLGSKRASVNETDSDAPNPMPYFAPSLATADIRGASLFGIEMPFSVRIVIGVIILNLCAYWIELGCSRVSVRSTLVGHSWGLFLPMIIVGLLVLRGLSRGSRQARSYIRLVTLLIGIPLSGVEAIHALSELRSPTAATQFAVVTMIVLPPLIIFFGVGVRSARAYSGMICPECGTRCVKSLDWFFSGVGCKKCTATWG